MLLTRGQNQKPDRNAMLIPNHPFTPDVLCVPFFNNAGLPFELNRRVGASIVAGTTAWVGDRRGSAWQHASTNAGLGWLMSYRMPLAEATIVIGYRKIDATNRASCAFGYAGGFGDTTKRMQAHVPYSDGTVYWDFAGATAGTSRLSIAGLTFGDDIWIFSVGPRGMEIWQNGILRASQTGHATRTQSPDISWGPGHGDIGGGSEASDLVNFQFLYVYGRQFVPEESKWISEHPWGMFAPSRIRQYDFFVPIVAAAGSGATPAIINNPVVF